MFDYYRRGVKTGTEVGSRSDVDDIRFGRRFGRRLTDTVGSREGITLDRISPGNYNYKYGFNVHKMTGIKGGKWVLFKKNKLHGQFKSLRGVRRYLADTGRYLPSK